MKQTTTILTWFKNISEGWKIFFGIVGMVTVISTAAVKVDHFMNKKVSAEVRIDKWIRYDSLEHIDSKDFRNLMLNNFQQLSDSLRTTNKGVRKLSTINTNMKKYMENKVATKDGLLEVQSIFNIEKKNENLSMIPFKNANLK